MNTLEDRPKTIGPNKKPNSKLSSPRKHPRESYPENATIPAWAMDEYKQVSKEFDALFRKVNRSKKEF